MMGVNLVDVSEEAKSAHWNNPDVLAEIQGKASETQKRIKENKNLEVVAFQGGAQEKSEQIGSALRAFNNMGLTRINAALVAQGRGSIAELSESEIQQLAGATGDMLQKYYPEGGVFEFLKHWKIEFNFVVAVGGIALLRAFPPPAINQEQPEATRAKNDGGAVAADDVASKTQDPTLMMAAQEQNNAAA